MSRAAQADARSRSSRATRVQPRYFSSESFERDALLPDNLTHSPTPRLLFGYRVVSRSLTGDRHYRAALIRKNTIGSVLKYGGWRGVDQGLVNGADSWPSTAESRISDGHSDDTGRTIGSGHRSTFYPGFARSAPRPVDSYFSPVTSCDLSNGWPDLRRQGRSRQNGPIRM